MDMRGSDREKIAAELAKLTTESIYLLRARWRRTFRRDPPTAFGPDLLRRSLAQRLQEDAFGGLSPTARRELERAVRALGRNPSGRIEIPRRVKVGAMLVREWKGVAHRVVVLDQGFTYRGKTFASLSEIAREITGTRWNGPRFFGLRVIEPAPPKRGPAASDNQAECPGKPPERPRNPAKHSTLSGRLPEPRHGL